MSGDESAAVANRSRPSGPARTLAIALALASLFCLHGIGWGGWETWHPDQMAFRNLAYDGRPLNPDHFIRPPLYSYVVWVALLPIRAWNALLQPDVSTLATAQLYTAGLVSTLSFLLAIVVLFRIARRIFGPMPAALVSLLFATTAGFVASAHFLTVDLPLAFVMLVAIDAAQRVLERDVSRDSIVTGLAVGLATATKYNGLAVGIALPLAHVLREGGPSLARKLQGRNLWLGLAMIPLGFFVGNPYAALDARRFLEDFLYTCAVAPRFAGETTGVSYDAFVTNAVQVLGWPQSLLIAASLAGIASAWARGHLTALQVRHLSLLSAVLILYFAVMGSFPRLPIRFVLPVLPLLIVFSGWVWARLLPRRMWWMAVLVPLLTYNVVCSWIVGERFRADPRHRAQEWLAAHLPAGASVVYTAYAPRPDIVPGVRARATRMPWISGRRRLFSRMLADRPFLRPALDRAEPPTDPRWYSTAALERRGTDVLVLDSLFYDRFITGKNRTDYPGMVYFFESILSGGSPYQVVFDADTEPPPFWSHPQTIDFLANRVIILRRNAEPQR